LRQWVEPCNEEYLFKQILTILYSGLFAVDLNFKILSANPAHIEILTGITQNVLPAASGINEIK